MRLDLAESPIEEATRCLDLGAGGIKLHPRAQKFLLDDERLAPVFELAADRKVPILIHGGRGLPPIADALARLMDAYEPQLIVAHAGIADLAALARHFSGRPGVFFDTSVWSPLDLLDLYRLVSPEQVLYASDYPYGTQPSSLLSSLRTARMAGLDDAQLRAMLGGSARRIAAGEDALPLTAPRGPQDIAHPLTFARIHQYLSMATPLLWMRQADTIGVLGLALNACDERSNGHREETELIRELLSAARDLWRLFPRGGGRDRGACGPRIAFRLVHLANITAVTSAACATSVNGHDHSFEAAVGQTLAETLRDDLGLTGTKIACGEGHCGACTVQLDGVPVLSCITLVHTVGEREVTTIEGLKDHPLVDAFVRTDALQCGFCTPGQIVSAAALVAEIPDPTSDEIRHRMAGNLCRCGTYPRIEEAISTWRG